MIATATKNGHAKTTNGAASPEPAPGDNDAGRDANGRFAKGNKLGTGNPFARQVAALRQQIINRTAAQDLDEIVDGLIFRAKGGDLAATKLLLGYLVGKPANVVNPDTLDLEEWQLRAQAPTKEESNRVMARLPFDLANIFAGGMDDVHWQIADQEVEKSEVRVAAKEAPPPAGNGARSPARHTARSIQTNRLTKAFAQSKKAKKRKEKSSSIFQRLRGNAPRK
jgi:hypothetical protein